MVICAIVLKGKLMSVLNWLIDVWLRENKKKFSFIFSNNEIILGANHCNIPRIVQVIVDCFIRDGIDMENLVAKRMINICKHVQVREN